MEIWDLYDENRNLLDKKRIRGNSGIGGEYHIVVGIWTVNSKNQVLLTLRDPNKEDYANYWENSGGSILQGETSKQGAKRELLEETGIKIEEEELFYLGTNKGNTYFHDVYVIRKDIEITELILQEGETVDAKWVTVEELDRMIENEEIAKPVVEVLNLVRKKLEDFLYNK